MRGRWSLQSWCVCRGFSSWVRLACPMRRQAPAMLQRNETTMRERDPRDRHYPERLTASYILSLVLHALAALLMFSIASSSSQEGATQDVAGGEVVTFSKIVTRAQPAVASPQPPVPAAPKIAPLRHAPAALPATQPLPPRPRELSVIATNAPPLPKPLPQA